LIKQELFQDKKSTANIPLFREKKAEGNLTSNFVSQFFVFQSGNYIGWDCFNKEKISVGKGRNADLILNDEHICDIHALFYCKGDHIVVSDQSFGQGVRVNGKLVKTYLLEALDYVTIGPFTLKIKVKKIIDHVSDPKALPKSRLSHQDRISPLGPPKKITTDNFQDNNYAEEDAPIITIEPSGSNRSISAINITGKDNLKSSVEPALIEIPAATLEAPQMNPPEKYEGIVDKSEELTDNKLKKGIQAQRRIGTEDEVSSKKNIHSYAIHLMNGETILDKNDKGLDKEALPESDEIKEQISALEASILNAQIESKRIQDHILTLEPSLLDEAASDDEDPVNEFFMPSYEGINPNFAKNEIQGDDNQIDAEARDNNQIEAEAVNQFQLPFDANGKVEDDNQIEAKAGNDYQIKGYSMVEDDEDEDEDEEEDEDEVGLFSLKEKLVDLKIEKSSPVNGRTVIEVVKYREHNVIDVLFLDIKEKYSYASEQKQFCLADHKNSNEYYIYFTDQMTGNVLVNDTQRITITELCTKENLHKKRKKIYRYLLPENGAACISDGYNEYLIRKVVQSKSPYIPEPAKKKSDIYKNLIRSALFHTFVLVLVGIFVALPSPPEPQPPEPRFVELDTRQLTETIKKIPKIEKKPQELQKMEFKEQTPQKPAKKTIRKPKKTANRKKKKGLVIGNSKKKGAVSRHPNAGGGQGF